MGDFFIHLESRFRFFVATENLGKFHHDAEAVSALFFAHEIEVLFIKVGGVFLLVQIPVDIGAAFQDDFIFWKVLEELVDGCPGFGDGAGVSEEASFAKSEPREVGGFCSLSGIEVFVKVAGEGSIEGVADKGDHPREGDLGLVGGFSEGETGEEATDKEADIRGEAEIRFIDGAHRGSDAVGEEWADPVFCFGANSVGAEGVDMVGYGAFTETGVGKFEGAFEVPCVPTCVECDLVPRGPFRCDFGFSIDFDIKSACLKEDSGLLDPIVSHAVGVIFFLDGADIKERATGELRLFGFDGVLNHAADNFWGGTIETGHEDEVVCEKLSKGADPFVGEVRVGDEAVGGESPEGEEGEFGIDGGSVRTELGHEGFGGNDGWVLGNFERNASHENHDPDRIFLRLLDREIVG